MTAATAAIVSDGVVQTLVLVDINADRETTFAWGVDPSAEVVVLPDGSPVSSGWGHDGETFTEPA